MNYFTHFCQINDFQKAKDKFVAIIDTHSHIYSEEFDADRADMMQRAKDAGIRKILMPAIDSKAHKQMLALEAAYPHFCSSMMGLHPCYVRENFEEELRIVEDYFKSRSFIAVGEIGLDFYWDKTFTKQQYEAFNRQIKLALQYDVPIAIHSRNATDECIEVVKQHQNGKLKGVFHCFSGNAEQAKKVMDLNFYLGIGGVVTFKNGGLDAVLQQVGLSKVILETDAPYLAPVPFRGKRNEPSYLSYVTEKIAAILNREMEEIKQITTLNANKLFNLTEFENQSGDNMQVSNFDKIKKEITSLGFRIISEDLKRPWGGFLVLDETQAAEFIGRFFPDESFDELNIAGKLSPKILIVAPGKRLSWQYHKRRAELWCCIEGKIGVVTSNTDEEKEYHTLAKGDKIILKQSERHRLKGLDNWGVVAEIWQHTDANNLSDEDDIVRLQDDFGR